MKYPLLEKINNWIQAHPGIFQIRNEKEGLWVLENYSQKSRLLPGAEIQEVASRPNPLNPGESYLIVLFNSGQQLVLSQQGFVFPPDFTHTGPIPLPSQVYCMQDFQNLFGKLQHLAAEPDRGRESLELVMILIAILDGARAAGLEVTTEAREVDRILSNLEQGQALPDPHGK